ncbi:MAG: PKD domain-containing protein [Ferruginibacter sp.]
MRNLLIILLGSLLMLNCSKPDRAIPNEQQQTEVQPSASFRITNEFSPGYLLEANLIDFVNESSQACSYTWDFGNGIVSHSRIPSDISFTPCGGKYTITLRVKAANGKEDSFSKEYEIQCRGRNAGNGGKMHQHENPTVVHWGTREIEDFKQTLPTHN